MTVPLTAWNIAQIINYLSSRWISKNRLNRNLFKDICLSSASLSISLSRWKINNNKFLNPNIRVSLWPYSIFLKLQSPAKATVICLQQEYEYPMIWKLIKYTKVEWNAKVKCWSDDWCRYCNFICNRTSIIHWARCVTCVCVCVRVLQWRKVDFSAGVRSHPTTVHRNESAIGKFCSRHCVHLSGRERWRWSSRCMQTLKLSWKFITDASVSSSIWKSNKNF